MSATQTETYSEPHLSGDMLRASKWPGVLALAATLFVHLAVVLALPDEIMRFGEEDREDTATKEYEISLITPDQMRFVEANPEAPENEPDQTDRYSYRSQQAADSNPLQDAQNLPSVDGEEDTQKILQGTLEQSPPIEPGVYAPPAREGEGEGNEGGQAGSPSEPTVVPLAQPLPPPDFIEQKPVTEEGPGSRLEMIGEAPEVVEMPDPEAPLDVYRPQPSTDVNLPLADGGGGSVEAQPQPRARPRLAPELLTGPLMRSQGSASRRGSLAIDATFSEFGEYEQQFYAAIQTGWYQEIEFFQPIDTATRVHVRLTIHSDGRVTDVEAVYSTASEIATVICESAVTKRSPFRPWTREMVRVFGQERTLNIVFHYR